MSDHASVLSSGTSLSSQKTAEFTPLPWFAPVVGLVNTLISIISQAHANKNVMRHLQPEDRCIGFLVVVQKTGDSAPPQEQQRLVAGIQTMLCSIINCMDRWCSKSSFELFVNQADLETAIRDCHMVIDDSLTKLQIIVAPETVSWESDFQADNGRDQAEILRYLSNVENTQSIVAMTQHQQSADIKAIMALMQQNLSTTPDHDTRGLATNLYRIQKSSGKLLVNMHLQRGEVCRLGQYPVSATGSMDVWEGIYLNEEKVTIKILRAVHSTPRSQQRFRREADIWNRVWETDKGRHILPLYGFCQDDGPFPYIVSPWHPNGTADKYVAQHPEIDHLALIRGISAGIHALHTMTPPTIHGDVRGANVIIDSVGNPLLANFGILEMVDDITGIPFTESSGGTALNSQRWLAPELCFDKGKLTMLADVYAFGMTILELMTHAMPWATFRHTTQVIIKVASGDKPPRPSDPATIARGLDDHLWEVMQKCCQWDEVEIRPTAAEVMQMLPVPEMVYPVIIYN